MMRTILLLLTAIVANACMSQHAYKSCYVRHFLKDSFEVRSYKWENPEINLHLKRAEANYRTSDCLLGIGIATGCVGTAGIVGTAAYGSRMRQYRTPALLTSLAFGIVAMPLSFVMRDVFVRKAKREIVKAKSMTANF